MLYGIINVPVTDLRARSESTSERVSQALFGTPVQVGKSQKGFTRVILPDNYTGWARTGHIQQVNRGLWQKYTGQSKRKVRAESVLIKSGPGIQTYPFRLFFGTELVVRPHNGQVHFELPGGKIRAPIGASCLRPGAKKKEPVVTGKRIIATASRFIGVPYLWGGITPCGFDCSGLAQIVYGYHGIKLPRDSRAQRDEGTEVNRNELRAGDLLFFPGHVAVSCGGTKILHASASRGMVTFDSLDPEDSSYRDDLERDYLVARRVLP
jgi:hypothetical protein